MFNLSCADRGQGAIGSRAQGRMVSLRKIYLAERSEALFVRALELLGKTAVSYRSSEYWISVREGDYLRASVLLKNHGIHTEIASG